MRNLKKLIALVAVFAMMVSTVAFAQTFTDVVEEHEYYEAIEMLSSLEILTGDDQDGDGKVDFRPNDTITRAEVAAIISRIQNITSAAQTATEFADVPSTHWASGYVAQAAGQGIVNGYGDGNFGPEDPVLYEQAVKMLVETLGYAPFVNDNGGYPTGHLTAASRYGVLEGVNGATIGAQATRGMVAQMVYNAIDTPLMDRYTYGADAEYVIYNGKGDYDYVSLLSRDLGVKKFSGIVWETQITGLESWKDIDTDDEAEIVFSYDDTDDYWNYDCNEIDTVYEADSDASKLLGMHVNVYVKESGRKGDYDIISIAQTNKNKVAEFTLDQFAGADGSYVEYYKNETDRTTTKLKLEASYTNDDNETVGGYSVIYNNVATDDDINELITVNSPYSGKVTLVDNDSTSGYDVVFVEIGAPAVVDEIASNGKIVFKEVPRNSNGEKIDIIVDEEDNTQIVELTKDGAAIDYTELQEWDVLSILYNENAEYYVAKVLDSTKIEGTVSGRSVSETSAYVEGEGESKAAYKFNINGTYYDVAQNYYSNSNKISVGASGLFYIDEYGKIIAYDKNGTTTVSDAYAYVLATSDIVDEWENKNVRVLMLDKSGAIYDAQLASSIKIENAAATNLGIEDGTHKLDNLNEDGKIATLAAELQGKLITYSANSQGELKTITFAQNDQDEATLTLYDYTTNGSYDEEDRELNAGSKYELADDTIVFYINSGDKDLEVAPGTSASKTASKVGTVSTIATVNSGLEVAVYDADDDIPAVVVLYNTTGGISPSSNIAVIDEIGSASVDGDTVTSVSFFMNGEKKYATCDIDMDDDAGLEDAKQGDLYKLALSADGTVITAAELYGSYTDRVDGDWDAAPTMAFTTEDDDEVFYFGPVVDYRSNNKSIRIAAATETGYDLASEVAVKATGANVYVYDPIRNSNKLYVGDASDVAYNDDLTEKSATDVVYEKGGDVMVEAGVDALGMMDFVAAVEYDGDVLDVVIYKAYNFGKYVIE